MDDRAPRSLATRLIHPPSKGDAHAPGARSGVSPVEERSTTFFLDARADEALATRIDVASLDVYGRFGTETTRDAARLVAELEGAPAAVLTASGMAAIHALFVAMLPPGGRLVAADSLYGGTDGLIEADLSARGVRVDRFDPTDPSSLARALGEGPTDLVWCEAIANPRMQVAAIDELAALCRPRGVALGIDGTFAAGLAVRPLERGADLVMHSATKFLNGHSDVIAGAVAGSSELVARVYAVMTRVGGCIDPHGAWLLARGIRTLPLRWARQVESAGRLARTLAEHPAVRRVDYPGLDPVGGARLESPGAMLAFELDDGAAARRFVAGLELCTHATSLGGLETLVSIPARSSHANLPAERRAALGIAEGLVRVSVGVEDPADLCEDVVGALHGL